MSSGRPTPIFYLAILAVVGGLLGFAYFRFMGDDGKPPDTDKHAKEITQDELDEIAGLGAAEAADTGSVTTAKTYEFVPSQRLPEVKGTSEYKAMEDNTVRFALNIWAGWAPIIHANNGRTAGKIWKTADGKEFKVDLVLIDNPVQMRDTYAVGEVHVGWATLDMMPLFMDGFVQDNGKPKDSRIMPRIYQQVDWSNGGDGIVVRENIKTVKDIIGKRIVLAENSPSHYCALRMLVSGGVRPSQVKFEYTTDAFAAAKAFEANPEISGVVSWAPDIYNLSDAPGNRMLVTTATANKLIADVWFARADFAQDHPDICEGLVRGIFDSMEALKSEAEQEKAAKLMGDVFSIPPAEAKAMLADAHSTNWAENANFFMNKNNPSRFESIWNQAYYLYGNLRQIRNPKVAFDQVMDFSIIEKLGKEEKYKNQVDEYKVPFRPKTLVEVAEADEVLTNTIVIHFYPNSHDLNHKNEDGELYDPNVEQVLEEVGRIASEMGGARVVIEGHTDSSMRKELGNDDRLVKQLSAARAKAVMEAVVKKFNFDANRFNSVGAGWDRPFDPSDIDNHAKNRRVEVRIYTAEKE